MTLVTKNKNCYHCCSFWQFLIGFILPNVLDICIATMAVSLSSVKSDSTGTTFKLNFVCFFILFICYYIESIRTFLFETLKSIPPLNAKFKKNNCKSERLCLIGVLSRLKYNARVFSFFVDLWTQTTKTGSEGLLYMLYCKIRSCCINQRLQVGHKWSKFKIFSLHIFRNVILKSKSLLTAKTLFKMNLMTYSSKRSLMT